VVIEEIRLWSDCSEVGVDPLWDDEKRWDEGVGERSGGLEGDKRRVND